MTAEPVTDRDGVDGDAPAVARRLVPLVDAALTGYLDRTLPRVVGLHPAVAPLADELRAFTARGKRLRPVLLLLGHAAGGGVDPDAVMGPALALELLHTCALLHDDIIDAAPQRRGRPTTHVTFAARHAEAGWAGSSRGFGEAVAILLGDLAFVHADDAFLEARVAPGDLLAGFRRFTVLREEVMVGQYLDVLAGTSRSTDRAAALRVATLKSGRYSVARPLEIGALLAGADEDLVAGLHAFGDPLGRAFQVRDDLLGVFGDRERTGKSDDSDLREGKRTLLVAETVARLDADAADAFTAVLGRADMTVAQADGLRRAMVDSGARAATEDYVRAAIAQAGAALEDLAITDELRVGLRGVAEWLGARND